MGCQLALSPREDRGAERPSHKEKETPQQAPVRGPLWEARCGRPAPGRQDLAGTREDRGAERPSHNGEAPANPCGRPAPRGDHPNTRHMQPPWHRHLLRWAAALLLLGLLIQTGIILRNQGAEPDAAIVLEGDPQRIRYAAQFAKVHPALPIYISSEPVFYKIYLDTLAEEQVPIGRFNLRTCATDTLTNFTCIVDELNTQGYRHLYLITSAHHMPRALTIGRVVLGRHGIALSPLPVATNRESKESLPRTLRDALRAILWTITGITGPGKTVRPALGAQSSARSAPATRKREEVRPLPRAETPVDRPL